MGPLLCLHQGCVVRAPNEEAMVLRLPNTPAALHLADPLEIDWRDGEGWW